MSQEEKREIVRAGECPGAGICRRGHFARLEMAQTDAVDAVRSEYMRRRTVAGEFAGLNVVDAEMST